MSNKDDDNDNPNEEENPTNKSIIPSSSRRNNISKTTSIQNSIEFGRICGHLKSTLRKGWVLRSVPGNVESVADHSWRVSILPLLLLSTTTSSLDVSKCMKLAIVHDLAEALVGDIVPSQNISKERKAQMEEDAIRRIANLLHSEGKQTLLELFHEYEERTTEEAIIVKDLDLLDMILQADEYEQRNCEQDDDNDVDYLQEFFDGTQPERFRNDFVRELAMEVHRQREERVRMEKDQRRRNVEEKEYDHTSPLASKDVQFVVEYARSSKLSIREVGQVVRALRANDEENCDSPLIT